jgi:hypothetical protein
MEQKIRRHLLEWERNYIIPLAFIAGEATPAPLLVEWSRETASLFRTWGHFREPGTTQGQFDATSDSIGQMVAKVMHAMGGKGHQHDPLFSAGNEVIEDLINAADGEAAIAGPAQ